VLYSLGVTALVVALEARYERFLAFNEMDLDNLRSLAAIQAISRGQVLPSVP
jgi:hypothetical protein